MSSTVAARDTRVPMLGRGVAAAIGLLSVAAALGAGHLVAGLIAPMSSPFFAVGDTVIRFSPEFLTEFAKTTFGTADKPILLSGMAVAIALVAAVAGLLSRRSARPGLVVVAVLGVAGLAAVVFGPVLTPASVVAPLVALVVGLAAFWWLHRVALAEAGVLAAPAGNGPTRRTVLVGSMAAVGVGALAAGAGGVALVGGTAESRTGVTARLQGARFAERAPAIPADAAFPEVGTPSFVTPNADFYRVDTALQVPQLTAEDWTCRIRGMVDSEIPLRFEDLLNRPLVERTITMTCVSNEVGGPYVSTASFIGVELRDLLTEAGVAPGADQILSTSTDGWTAGTPVDVVMQPDRGALLAIGMNGEALPAEHGFPVRMVVPGLYGFLSATKWLTDIELTTFAQAQGYWLQRGWGQFGPIKTQCRIDSPRGFERVAAGTVTVAGSSWSQPVGIDRVEVRVDGGPWTAAQLSTEVNGSTWRMWQIALDLGPGSHTVTARATDRTGATQPEERVAPIPDGATGWPSTIFMAS